MRARPTALHTRAMTPAEAPAPPRFPRWTPWIVLIGGTLAVHVALPWAISLITRRYGWVQGHPGFWNLIGLIPVATGLVMIAWGGRLHIIRRTGTLGLEKTSRYMLVEGPYRFSRHPMYLLELVMWMGWAIFYGSIPVLIAFVVEWVVFAFAARYEERQLEARFDEAYLLYQKTVPRWFGPIPRSLVGE
jgi:protein-S-isoprenylcysteine O-methyltransferase Ste14